MVCMVASSENPEFTREFFAEKPSDDVGELMEEAHTPSVAVGVMRGQKIIRQDHASLFEKQTEGFKIEENVAPLEGALIRAGALDDGTVTRQDRQRELRDETSQTPQWLRFARNKLHHQEDPMATKDSDKQRMTEKAARAHNKKSLYNARESLGFRGRRLAGDLPASGEKTHRNSIEKAADSHMVSGTHDDRRADVEAELQLDAMHREQNDLAQPAPGTLESAFMENASRTSSHEEVPLGPITGKDGEDLLVSMSHAQLDSVAKMKKSSNTFQPLKKAPAPKRQYHDHIVHNLVKGSKMLSPAQKAALKKAEDDKQDSMLSPHLAGKAPAPEETLLQVMDNAFEEGTPDRGVAPHFLPQGTHERDPSGCVPRPGSRDCCQGSQGDTQDCPACRHVWVLSGCPRG